jgi:hypothetical protein
MFECSNGVPPPPERPARPRVQMLCGVGQYSEANATTCVTCPPGVFGNVTGLTTSACSGTCPAGFACPAGSTNATAMPCVSGQYSLAGAGNCSDMFAAVKKFGMVWTTDAADVDGDGRTDVLTAPAGTSVAFLRNDGGSASNWVSTAVSYTSDWRSVHAVDVDGDGRMDVVAADKVNGRVVWFHNRGGGASVVWTPYNVSTAAAVGVQSVHSGDLNGDGRVDLLSANYGDDRIVCYMNDGGTPVVWTPYNVSTAADGAVSVRAADIDGDGRLDVLSASSLSGIIAWHHNGGSSPVIWTTNVISGGMLVAGSVYAADIDGDGRLDVVTSSFLDDKVAWFRNGGGSPVAFTEHVVFTASGSGASPGGQPRWAHAVDVDGDGRVDVLSAFHAIDTVVWHRNMGGNPLVWSTVSITRSCDYVIQVGTADFNGDGRLDVFAACHNESNVGLYLNMLCPPGTFGPGGFSPCSQCPPGTFSDGSMQSSCGPCPAGRFGSGGSANALCSGPCTAGFACAAGSVNATATACPTGRFSQEGASGCSLLLAPQAITTTAGYATAVATGDFDGDGRLDVVASAANDNLVRVSCRVFYLRGSAFHEGSHCVSVDIRTPWL